VTDGLKDTHRRALLDILSANQRVERVVLFGSRAMGSYTPTSDVDLVLYGDALTLTDQARLAAAIDELPIPQRVDLVLFNTIDNDKLKEHIRKHGVEWFRRDGGAIYFNTTIGEQVTLQRGFDITKKQQRHGKIPVVSSGGVSSYHSEAMVAGPGVVLGRKGSLGTVFYINEDYWPHDTSLWVKDFKGNNPRFVYYFFSSIAEILKKLDVGAANPALNRNHVHPLPIKWTTRENQDDIVKVLGSIDDKIEFNRQVNQTLEEIAQALFKSWFVDFEPTKAKIKAKRSSQRPPLPPGEGPGVRVPGVRGGGGPPPPPARNAKDPAGAGPFHHRQETRIRRLR
jgi:predicted nucleotidyltransferase